MKYKVGLSYRCVEHPETLFTVVGMRNGVAEVEWYYDGIPEGRTYTAEPDSFVWTYKPTKSSLIRSYICSLG